MNQARDRIVYDFNKLKEVRYTTYMAVIEALPYFTLYTKYGSQRLSQPQVQSIQFNLQNAKHMYQTTITADWRSCCLKYPAMLDYFLSLIEIRCPDTRSAAIRDPRARSKDPHRINGIRQTHGSAGYSNGHRKKGRRRSSSRGRTPPRTPTTW